METIEWKKWMSKRDNPYPETDIVVRRKNGDVVFAYYADSNSYIFLTYNVNGDMIQTYAMKDFFTEGCEWAYVESLKRQRDDLKQDAVEVVKQMIADGQISQEVAEKYFPELAESEDERKHVQEPKIVVPLFRVGDTIRIKDSNAEYTITDISDGYYRGKGWCLDIVEGDASGDYELVEREPVWKPTDEQINVLVKLEEAHVMEHERNQENAHMYMVLKSLKEDLYKLRNNKATTL